MLFEVPLVGQSNLYGTIQVEATDPESAIQAAYRAVQSNTVRFVTSAKEPYYGVVDTVEAMDVIPLIPNGMAAPNR